MRLLLIPILLVFPTLLFAQEARPVQCRFLSFGGTGELPSVIAASAKGSEITCPLSSSQISPRITCFAVGTQIPFLSSTDKKPIATAIIPASVNAALLIFIHPPKTPQAAESAGAIKILVIEDTAKNFPDGGAFIANFYNKDIRFIVGEHKGMLHAGGFHGYAKPEEVDSFNMAPVVFEFQNDDKWHTANESALRFLRGMRYLIFAYVDPVSGRPRIQTYQDMPPVVPAKSTP